VTKFEFLEELPSHGSANRPGDQLLTEFADALRAHPGMWAAWPRPVANSTAQTVGSYIRGGRYVSLPANEFEGRYRGGVAYVRYVGHLKEGRSCDLPA